MMDINNTSDFLFYQGNDGKTKVQIILGDETVWTTQAGMSEIFKVDRTVISRHLQNIFNEGELTEDAVSAKNALTASDGKTYQTNFYNLDAIISVGYRVSSYEATQFRIWASQVLKEYLMKGFALDDERLKQGKTLFGKDYFDELLDRIRGIRASERRFYEKITDLYAECSIDYDKNSPITKEFYAFVQNKLHFAVTNQTAAEIVVKRTDSSKRHMGLKTWKNAPEGKILKSDVSVAKNYLSEVEIKSLERIVSMYLDYAENQASRHIPMKMADWITKLDAFLQFNDYGILKDAGKVAHKMAKTKAEGEFDKFRVVQDREYVSDFNKMVEQLKTTGKLPEAKYDTPRIPTILELQKKSEEERKKDLSSFNKNLDKALNYNPKDGE